MSVIKFAGDFETNNHIEDCRVWAYSLSEIGNPTNFIYGNSIEGFFDFCSDNVEYLVTFEKIFMEKDKYYYKDMLKDGKIKDRIVIVDGVM